LEDINTELTQDGKQIRIIGGTLIYFPQINGEIQRVITSPLRVKDKETVCKLEPKLEPEIDYFTPDELDYETIYRHVIDFIRKITNWENNLHM